MRGLPCPSADRGLRPGRASTLLDGAYGAAFIRSIRAAADVGFTRGIGKLYATRRLGGSKVRSSRQGRSLAGCKSPYRQLPVVGRLAYPIRGEVTTRVLLGRKSPGCPAGVRSGRDDLGGEQTWRPERNEISATSKIPPHEVVSSGILREADPLFLWGRPMAPWKKQARAHGVPPG
jgi:hypothetical protein